VPTNYHYGVVLLVNFNWTLIGL